MITYEEYIRSKKLKQSRVGLPDCEVDIGNHLFDFQAALVRYALRLGRSAIFADTGLGKTAMQIDWAKNISQHGRVLIVAPLAVGHQTVNEAARFGVDIAHDRTGHDKSQIVITNYEMLDRFDANDFVGVVLDESSILKSYSGETCKLLIEKFQNTKYRLACTATPAPNDWTELGNHSAFLGIKHRREMMSEFFIHDGKNRLLENDGWRLKGHARNSFWSWVSTWGAIIKKPSDLGFDDSRFELPPLRHHEHLIKTEHSDAWKAGALFVQDAATLNDQRRLRKATTDKRVDIIKDLVSDSEPALIWCELNQEGEAVTRAISDAVEVSGRDDIEAKEEKMLGFSSGKYRVLVTKAKIAGFGMNWQHCAKVIFVGFSHSFEQTYQSIRRCWRFGQKNPVDVHFVFADTENHIIKNYKNKIKQVEQLNDEMRDMVRKNVFSAKAGEVARFASYNPQQKGRWPSWLKTRNQ